VGSAIGVATAAGIVAAGALVLRSWLGMPTQVRNDPALRSRVWEAAKPSIVRKSVVHRTSGEHPEPVRALRRALLVAYGILAAVAALNLVKLAVSAFSRPTGLE